MKTTTTILLLLIAFALFSCKKTKEDDFPYLSGTYVYNGHYGKYFHGDIVTDTGVYTKDVDESVPAIARVEFVRDKAFFSIDSFDIKYELTYDTIIKQYIYDNSPMPRWGGTRVTADANEARLSKSSNTPSFNSGTYFSGQKAP